MSMNINQRNTNRNQSTLDISQEVVFIWDNRFHYGTFTNNTGGNFTLAIGQLVVRDTANAGGLLPAISGNLANVIGVVGYDGSVVLANTATQSTSYCCKGGIDANYLSLPAGVTLNTTVGSKSLLDVLEALGLFIDTSGVDNTNFDN